MRRIIVLQEDAFIVMLASFARNQIPLSLFHSKQSFGAHFKQRLFTRTIPKSFIISYSVHKMATQENHKPTVVFVLGGPGAGKGTQCSNLVDHYGFVHLSAGDLLRAEMHSGSQYGNMIAEMIKNGQIVPSSVTVGLLDQAMQKSQSKKFLIDGFPRNAENNDTWEKEMNPKVNLGFLLFFDCPENVMEERLLKRGVFSGRTDDNLDSIKKRFKTYVDQTIPTIQYYESKGKVVHIHADQTPDKVWEEVKRKFGERGMI